MIERIPRACIPWEACNLASTRLAAVIAAFARVTAEATAANPVFIQIAAATEVVRRLGPALAAPVRIADLAGIVRTWLERRHVLPVNPADRSTFLATGLRAAFGWRTALPVAADPAGGETTPGVVGYRHPVRGALARITVLAFVGRIDLAVILRKPINKAAAGLTDKVLGAALVRSAADTLAAGLELATRVTGQERPPCGILNGIADFTGIVRIQAAGRDRHAADQAPAILAEAEVAALAGFAAGRPARRRRPVRPVTIPIANLTGIIRIDGSVGSPDAVDDAVGRARIDAAYPVATTFPRPTTDAVTTVSAVGTAAAAALEISGIAGNAADPAGTDRRPMRGTRTADIAGPAVVSVGRGIDASATAWRRKVRRAGTEAVCPARAVNTTAEWAARLPELIRIRGCSAHAGGADRRLALRRSPAPSPASTTILGVALVLIERNASAAALVGSRRARAPAGGRITESGAAIAIRGAASPNIGAPLGFGKANTGHPAGARDQHRDELLQHPAPRNRERARQTVKTRTVHRGPRGEKGSPTSYRAATSGTTKLTHSLPTGFSNFRRDEVI